MFDFLRRRKSIPEPLAKRQEYDRKVNEIKAHVDITRLNFLIVDDNEMFLRLTSDKLKHEHVNLVHTARTGKEAMELYEKSEIGFYHVILTDIIMPDIYGYVLARNIRLLKRPDAQSVTILALSCNRVSQKDIKEGIDDFIEKPLNINQLVKKLELYLKFPV